MSIKISFYATTAILTCLIKRIILISPHVEKGGIRMGENRTYFCIDMKTFYASVECAERGLNPFETNLVVADPTRGKNALCLAVSPKLKALGVKNRCRLSDIPPDIPYEIAPPQMQRYIEYAADIYAIYLDYFAPEDIYVYSIDESFIDATNYLKLYHTAPKALTKKLINEIAERLHIPATAGIGSNLYLAKIALDITAKHAKDHMGILTEKRYQETLWDHRPITDFWMVAKGTAKRLERYGIFTMRGITEVAPETLYRTFGVNAELLIDHAWGREPCRISDIKAYKPQSRSVSFSQILPRDYSFEEARVVMAEMAVHGCQTLMRRKMIAGKVWIGVSYSRDTHLTTKGSIRLTSSTNVISLIQPNVLTLFDRVALREFEIRRLAICFSGICDEGCEGYDFFTDWERVEQEKLREHAVLDIVDKYGKNAILRGTNFLPGATQQERNQMIGGHRAGYDKTRTGETIHALRCYEGTAGSASGS